MEVISSVSRTIFHGDVSGHPLGVRPNLAGMTRRVHLVQYMPWWEVGPPTVPHGALDPSSVTVDSGTFSQAVSSGSWWAAMLLFLPEERMVDISDMGRTMRSMAPGLLSQRYLLSLLLPTATRDLALVSTSRDHPDDHPARRRRRPLTPLEEAKAHSRVGCAVHATRSLLKRGEISPIGDPARHAELAFAAAGGSAAAFAESAGSVRRAIMAVRSSSLPRDPDLMAVQTMALALSSSDGLTAGRPEGVLPRQVMF